MSDTDVGRVGKPIGLSQAEPEDGLRPTGFDPSRAAELLEAVEAFARESNRIEGIARTTSAQVVAHIDFLDGPVTIPALVAFVAVVQPNARFRNEVTVPGVRVGNHVAPPSGPQIEADLRRILAMREPWAQHVAYETLHPFTDGNGRSGRALWLHRYFHEGGLDPWAVRLGFLHSFYYHTLSNVRRDSDGRPEGRDREDGLDGAAATARAEGIAPPPDQSERVSRLEEALVAFGDDDAFEELVEQVNDGKISMLGFWKAAVRSALNTDGDGNG